MYAAIVRQTVAFCQPLPLHRSLASKTSPYILWPNIYRHYRAFRCINAVRNAPNDRRVLWCWSVGSLLVWLGLADNIETSERPLILTIKRGILCQMREQYSRAEIIFHLALKTAQQLCYDSAETYVLDMLANNAFLAGDHKTAEKLFIDVMKRVLAEGMATDDEAIIEMSLKLAHIYSQRREFEKSRMGFRVCLHLQRKRVADFMGGSSAADELNERQINSLALWGMCLEYYGKHLSFAGRHADAVDHYKQALAVCERINGSSHAQTLVLMNDLADVYVQMKDYDSALEYLKRVVERAIRTESNDLGVFCLNLGSVYLEKFSYDLARVSCRQSLDFSLQLRDRTLEAKARECLEKASESSRAEKS